LLILLLDCQIGFRSLFHISELLYPAAVAIDIITVGRAALGAGLEQLRRDSQASLPVMTDWFRCMTRSTAKSTMDIVRTHTIVFFFPVRTIGYVVTNFVEAGR
jgi:hypothetical protein